MLFKKNNLKKNQRNFIMLNNLITNIFKLSKHMISDLCANLLRKIMNMTALPS